MVQDLTLLSSFKPLWSISCVFFQSFSLQIWSGYFCIKSWSREFPLPCFFICFPAQIFIVSIILRTSPLATKPIRSLVESVADKTSEPWSGSKRASSKLYPSVPSEVGSGWEGVNRGPRCPSRGPDSVTSKAQGCRDPHLSNRRVCIDKHGFREPPSLPAIGLIRPHSHTSVRRVLSMFGFYGWASRAAQRLSHWATVK